MNLRQPLRAGSFYKASPTSCRQEAVRLLDSADIDPDLPARLCGGLVPHAGWMFSGKLAAETLKCLHSAEPLETVVLLGADHTGAAEVGEVFATGAWHSPLGDAQVDEQLASSLLAACDMLRPNERAHNHEHSIEVQVPILQALSPEAKIVPITIPADASAVEIGTAIGRTLAGSAPNVKVVGSTDLTHHGGCFPSPGGPGAVGAAWTAANDRRLIELIEQMAAEQIVPEVRDHSNACGAGAIAATIAACREMGATRGICLDYTNSYEIIHAADPDDPDDTTVGYASIVFA